MAFELVLDASESLAWVIRERGAGRAAYAEAIVRLAAGDTVPHLPIHWGIEMGHVQAIRPKNGAMLYVPDVDELMK